MTDNVGYFAKRALREAQSAIEEGEDILLTVRQSLISDIAPSFIIATNKRLIIINNSFFGLYLHKNLLTPTDYNTIYYNQITSIVLIRGKILDSINVRVLGAFDSKISPEKKTEGEIDGLNEADAKRLVDFVGKRLSELRNNTQQKEQAQNIPLRLYYAFKGVLQEEGAKTEEISYKEALKRVNEGTSKFIWLGTESNEYIGTLLKVSEDKIIKLDPDSIQVLDKEITKTLGGSIFVCYNGNLSKFVSRYLKKQYNIDTYTLKGGVVKALLG